jgi:hypothetical protein
MGDPGRWRGLQAGRRRTHVGRHEAPRNPAAARAAVVVVVVVVAVMAVAVAAVAVATRSSSSSRVANPPTSRAAASAPKLIAAPGFSFGLGEARAFPGTYLIKGQVGEPTAPFARLQRDPTVPAPKDPATDATMTGLTIRVVNAAAAAMPLRATVQVRGSAPGVTVLVRLSERVGDRRVGGGEGRATLRDTGWHDVAVGHRVVEAGASVHLEVFALALPVDQTVFIGQTKVTSP